MSSDIFVIYQIDNSEKNREYRCRSYEYQIQHGFMITADNYGTGYSGTATRGMGAEAIREKMESINPDKFKIRKFGVSDVIGLTEAGKTSFFYVDKDRLVRFNGFFPKPQSGTYLILDEGGYQVAGQKGTSISLEQVEEYEHQYQVAVQKQETAFKKVMLAVNDIEKAFSHGNPWLMKFRAISIPETLERAHLKEWLDCVWIVDFEQVEVILQESEWKGFFPEEWLNNGEEDCNGKKE